MTNVVMLFVCLVAGIALRLGNRVPPNAHLAINGFIINVALPALILGQIHELQPDPALIWPVLMPWIVFTLSLITFYSLGRTMRLADTTIGALIITAGLGNTSFVGLPMIETFYGTSYLPTGILIDQLGSYLVLGTIGITIATLFSTGKTTWQELALRIAKFPPLLALIVAFILLPLSYPPVISGLLHRLGDTLAPLALVSVGLQLHFNQVAGNRVPLALGLTFKLLLAPALMLLLYSGLLAQHIQIMRVTLFEAAMGPMISGAIVAMQYGLNPPLITLMVGVGITLSFVTLPAWYLCFAAL